MTETNDQPTDDRKPAHRRGRGKSDYYLTPRDENNIVATLLASRRWKATEQHKDAALAITTKNMGNEDARVSNAAVGNLIKMEAQNQADELKQVPDQHEHIVTIEEQRDSLAAIRTRLLAGQGRGDVIDASSSNGNGRPGSNGKEAGNGHLPDDPNGKAG